MIFIIAPYAQDPQLNNRCLHELIVVMVTKKKAACLWVMFLFVLILGKVRSIQNYLIAPYMTKGSFTIYILLCYINNWPFGISDNDMFRC